MIVDDEPDITYIIKKFLEVNGIEVDAFNDAEEALSHFQAGLYLLSILDIGMPKMNGFELYREIRKIEPNVKVCFLSAYETLGENRGFPRSELKCVLKKPISMPEFVNHVRWEIASIVAQEEAR